MNNIAIKQTASGKQIQSFMFLSTLRKEIDRMACVCAKDAIVDVAKRYIKLGMSRCETEELLRIDGYDPIMVKAFVQSDDFNDEVREEKVPQWEFDIEDMYGRIYSSSDFGIVIYADNQDDARRKAEEEVDIHSDIQINRIVDVYRI